MHMATAETPNTRGRRKREIALMMSEGSDLSWTHDQELRRAVLMAAENGTSASAVVALGGISCDEKLGGSERLVGADDRIEHFDPPTPTQQPRPVSSRLEGSPPCPSPSTSFPRPSSSSRPRKRYCRNHRSLPLPASNREMPSAGSSSAPMDDTGQRIDALLAQFTLGTDVNSTSTAVTKIAAEINPSPVLRPKSTNRGLSHPSPLRHTAGGSTDSIITASTSSGTTSKSSNIGHENSKQNEVQHASKSHSQSHTRPRPPRLSPNKRQNIHHPRLGVRASQTTKSIVQPSVATKPFKPPLLDKSGNRSSPRHAKVVVSYAQSTRPASIHTPLPESKAHTQPTTVITMHMTKKNHSEPSSDGVGDESVDSFDGMFVEGGPEIEELLRTVDGSQ